MKQTKREFNKIARKCKAIYVSLMVDLSVIPIKKAKTSQCSLVLEPYFSGISAKITQITHKNPKSCKHKSH